MSTFVLKKEYALQLPSSYVDIDREEMEYIDGGFSWNDAKWAVAVAIGWALKNIVGPAIKQSAVWSVVTAAQGWLAGAIDTMILTVWYHPWISLAVGGSVAWGVYYTDRKMGKW